MAELEVGGQHRAVSALHNDPLSLSNLMAVPGGMRDVVWAHSRLGWDMPAHCCGHCPPGPQPSPSATQLLGDLLTTLLAADGAHTDPSLVPAHTADTLIGTKVSMINHIILTETLALSAIVELKNK